MYYIANKKVVFGRLYSNHFDVLNESASNPRDPKPHVLMVVIDDLNDWISILGHPTVKTPQEISS